MLSERMRRAARPSTRGAPPAGRVAVSMALGTRRWRQTRLALLSTLAGLPDLVLAAARRAARPQRGEQPAGRRRPLVHRPLEVFTILCRGLVEAGHLAYILQGGGANLVTRRR